MSSDLIGADYQLYTAEGLLVEQGILSDMQLWINIAHLPNGYYILTVGQQAVKVKR